MRRGWCPEGGFADFEGAVKGFEEDREVFIHFRVGVLELRDDEVDDGGDVFSRRESGLDQERKGVGGEVGVDGTDGGLLVGAVVDEIAGGGGGATDADARRAAASEARIGVTPAAELVVI